jgi:hypothetical protein
MLVLAVLNYFPDKKYYQHKKRFSGNEQQQIAVDGQKNVSPRVNYVAPPVKYVAPPVKYVAPPVKYVAPFREYVAPFLRYVDNFCCAEDVLLMFL